MVNKKTKIKQSKAFGKFEDAIARSMDLISLHSHVKKLFDAEAPELLEELELDDVLRASAVIAIAAMDAYFTDVFAEKLIPFLKKSKTPPKKMVSFLSDVGLDTEEALRLLSMERPYRRVRTIVETYFETYTTQRFDIIDKLFLSYNIKDFTLTVENILKKKTLKRNIQLLIKRRHQIVHDGDCNSHGKLIAVGSKWLSNRVENIFVFVGGAEEFLYRRLN